ncbi:AAA family ATPase [Planctomycetota bacterium]|nr:AAA family ATPase [Planctomycetota bacterium]
MGRFAFHAQDERGGQREELRVELLPTRGYVDRFEALEPKPWADAMYDDKSPAFFVVGYGASRRVESDRISEKALRRGRLLRYQRVAGLFEEHVTLMPLSAWLPDWQHKNPGRHSQVVNLLNRLLPDGCRMEPKPTEDEEYLFRIGGSTLPFPALSDGYRAYIGWVADLLYHICMGCPPGVKLIENRGIVLLDEIGLHLHPAWQQSVIPRLATTLKNIQFVATSHSPLLVGTLDKGNLRVLIHGGQSTKVESVAEETYGKSVDQILTSPSFGLDTPRDVGFTERVNQVAAEARDGAASASLKLLEMLSLGADAMTTDELRGLSAAKKRKKASKKKASKKKASKKKASKKKASKKKGASR